MAWLLLSDRSGTSRLYHPAMAGHYDAAQSAETRDVDGSSRRVVHLKKPVAERLVDEGVGEDVLPEDYFDDSGDSGEADTPADDADEADDTDGGDDEDEPPDETADTEDADVADSEAADEDDAE